ncbi:GNAT family N-acetyltransferase [Actinacidiphila acididurans]|uniref:GNAT family N-acetyltransferase n=1 Tax=Actinacidiphila acididurans TaxID=2784346 RepID=UPI0027DD3958|nr:GNAT family protein [Actinacidiphila acididurans]
MSDGPVPHEPGRPSAQAGATGGVSRRAGGGPTASGSLAQYFGGLRPVRLVAGDLVLRPFDEGDEAAVGEAMTDPEVLRWAAGRVVLAAVPGQRGATWLGPRLTGWSSGTAAFAVTDAADGTLLGYVGLRDVHRTPDQAVAAYWVTPAARGRAVAARALRAAADWGFSALRLHRISLDHALVNPASCRTAEKAGFRVEGTMRESFIAHDGRRHDSHLHARLATDPVPEP